MHHSLLFESAAVHRDYDVLQRCARIGKHVLVKEIGHDVSAHGDLGGVDPRYERVDVVESDWLAFTCRHHLAAQVPYFQHDELVDVHSYVSHLHFNWRVSHFWLL